MKKTVTGSILLVTGVLGVSSAFSDNQAGVLWVNLKNNKTFGDYGITQVMLQTYCDRRTFAVEKTEPVGAVESKSESNIAKLGKLAVHLNCEGNSGVLWISGYTNLKPVSVTVQLRYKDKLVSCEKINFSHPDWWSHNADINSFSGELGNCSLTAD